MNRFDVRMKRWILEMSLEIVIQYYPFTYVVLFIHFGESVNVVFRSKGKILLILICNIT